ncbi:MAG: hypothetical protein V1777_04560 [Candidatus Micrarchaeota archaeon]
MIFFRKRPNKTASKALASVKPAEIKRKLAIIRKRAEFRITHEPKQRATLETELDRLEKALAKDKIKFDPTDENDLMKGLHLSNLDSVRKNVRLFGGKGKVLDQSYNVGELFENVFRPIKTFRKMWKEFGILVLVVYPIKTSLRVVFLVPRALGRSLARSIWYRQMKNESTAFKKDAEKFQKEKGKPMPILAYKLYFGSDDYKKYLKKEAAEQKKKAA